MQKKESNYELKDHQLFAASSSLWKTLQNENEISSNKKKLSRKISMIVSLLSVFRFLQRLKLKYRLKNSALKDEAPIFVIGHWRSGTTHLHYLLSQDKRFIHLGAFQGFFFNMAFTTKWFFKPILKRLMPTTRPQDNVKIDVDAPTEDEHALVNITRMSGMQAFFFPKNKSYFNKFNCFDGISSVELKEWKAIYSNMLKQIELFNQQDGKLLLKNPHNTARIKVLSEIYPKAKFVYIHRNPYDVYNSTLTLYDKAVRSQFLQDFSDKELTELIIYNYEKMISGYIKHRETLPKDMLVEIAYKDLVLNPLGELERVYNKLDLGEFKTVKPNLENYITSLGKYKVNPSKPIDSVIEQKIIERWGFAFEEWGYTK